MEQPSGKQAQVGERFKISVYARFRPKRTNYADGSEIDHSKEKAVTLPLHQRLSMIRMSHRLTSNISALKILAAEGQWFEAKWDALLTPSTQTSEADKVADRSFFSGQPGRPQILALRALRGKQSTVGATKSVGSSEFSACVHSMVDSIALQFVGTYFTHVVGSSKRIQ